MNLQNPTRTQPALVKALTLCASIEIPHPSLADVTLVVWGYPDFAEAAWRLGDVTLWRGLPCEA